MSKDIKEILIKALDIGRYAPKSIETYSFLDDEEKEEMVTRILKELKDKGYKIIKEE
jgi:hypothetical protein